MGKTIGGLARRATFFSRHNTSHTLRIAGPYEFAPPHPPKPLDLTSLKPLFKGYEYLAYDIGVLGKSEASALPILARAKGQTWFTAGSHPHVQSLITPQGPVMAVVFPALDNGHAPSPAMLQELVSTLTNLQETHPDALILGISSWGRNHEKTFLHTYEGTCHILLGSGPGSGQTGTLSPHAKTMWVRAFAKGKIINSLEIRAFPSSKQPFRWKLGRTIFAQSVILDETIADDSAMQHILAPLKQGR